MSYCHLKWDELSLDLFNRNVASCCQATRHGFKTGADISDIFNAPELVADRSAMLNSEKPTSCNYCWNSEQHSGKSRRTKTAPVNFYSTPYISFPKTLIVTLQSNLCQLSCVYCSHYYSSSWYKDIDLNGNYTYQSDLYSLSTKDKIKFKVSLNDFAQSQLGSTLQHIIDHPEFSTVEQISFGGGEPLLAASLIPTIKKIVNKSPNTKILISTGLGVSDTQFNNFLKETQDLNLIISASNDTVGKLSEFVRYGITWDKWASRFIALTQNKNYTIRSTCVASIVTIFGLHEFLNFYLDHIADPTAIDFNFLETPAFLDIKNFDESLTNAAIDNLVTHPLVQDHYKQTFLGFRNVQIDNPTITSELATFLTEFAKRRNLNLSVLPPELQSLFG